MSRPINQCTVDGCSARAYGKGYCHKHYMRVRRRGTLETTKPENGAKLVWAKTVALECDSDECLLFPFPVGSHGYGDITVDGGKVLFHRYICEQAHGAPPTSSHQAAHRCGTKLCGNKRHLRWATVIENAADKIVHGRDVRGESHGQAKLTRGDVLAIRATHGRQSEIAAQYGVAQQTVSDVKGGRRWAWL